MRKVALPVGVMYSLSASTSSRAELGLHERPQVALEAHEQQPVVVTAVVERVAAAQHQRAAGDGRVRRPHVRPDRRDVLAVRASWPRQGRPRRWGRRRTASVPSVRRRPMTAS